MNKWQWMEEALRLHFDEKLSRMKTARQLNIGKRPARTVLTGMCYSVGSATRQGSSSLTRLTGQSAITSSTWRR